MTIESPEKPNTSRLSPSLKAYLLLIIVLTVLSGVSVFLPFAEGTVPPPELPASKMVVGLVNAALVLVFYGTLGYIGLRLSERLGFARIWDEKVSNRQRFLIPGLIGVALGLFLILADSIFSRFHTLGQLPHPPFPTSIIASLSAGIGEELLFRLFLVSFWVWLISHSTGWWMLPKIIRIIFFFISFCVWLISYVLPKNRGQNLVFWVVSVFSALAFAFGHFPSLTVLFGMESFGEIPPALIAEIILLNGVISIFAAYYLRKYGFLAPVGIHFWADVVWHVVWGLILAG